MPLDPILERKLQVLIKLRNYKLLEREETKEGALITVENHEGKKVLIWAI